MHQYFLSAFFLLYSGFAYSQEANVSDSTKDFDGAYIKNYADSLTTRVYAIRKFSEIDLSSKNGNDIVWKSNDNLNLGVGFNYKWLGLNVAVKSPFINNDDSTYGKTESFNLITNIYLRKMGFDFYIQHIKGFYQDNISKYNPTWEEGDPYPNRRDIIVYAIGMNYYYIFNNGKFSYRASFLQNERQLKSAGSFIAGSFISFVGLRSDSSFIPKNQYKNFDKSAIIEEGNYLTAGFSGGYAHNFIILKNLFISPSLDIGFSVQASDITTEDKNFNNKNRQPVTSKVGFRIALGYNDDFNFLGLTGISENLVLGKSVDYQLGTVRFIYAHRFAIKNFIF